MKKIYQYDNQIFHSIRELSDYSGVHLKTLTARLRRGMSVDEACEKTDIRCKYYDVKGENKSVAQLCRENKKDPDLVRNRLKYGYTIEKALNTPKKVQKQGQPIVVNGILYNSIAAAIRELNLEKKESTIRRRLKKNMKPDDAFMF